MVVKEKKQHSKKFLNDIANAKNTIKEAEDNMKKMDSEVKDFHKHMALSMSKLMQTFQSGFSALDQAKKDEK